MADEEIRTELGQFKLGFSGNPKGRPKGARAKLGEAFLEAMQKDFEEHGEAVIQTVRQERPQDYLKVIASLLPKDVNLNVNNMDDATDDEIIQRLRELSAFIGPLLGLEGLPDAGAGIGPETAH